MKAEPWEKLQHKYIYEIKSVPESKSHQERQYLV